MASSVLPVYITEGSEGGKSDTFTNTYSAGALSISKTVDGNMGDHDKYFEFTITLTGEEGKTYADSYAITGGTYDKNPETISVNGEAVTVMLKDGDTINIANLPYGVSYTVVETDANADGYTANESEYTGTISAETQSADFCKHQERRRRHRQSPSTTLPTSLYSALS